MVRTSGGYQEQCTDGMVRTSGGYQEQCTDGMVITSSGAGGTENGEKVMEKWSLGRIRSTNDDEDIRNTMCE